MWIRWSRNSESETRTAHSSYSKTESPTLTAMHYKVVEPKPCVPITRHSRMKPSNIFMLWVYPYICEYDKFPIGHTIINVEEACNNKVTCLQVEGLIKCSIVPPINFYHPVLPYRCNNKILYCLCRSCVYARNISGDCKHLRDDERTLTGTWVLDEIRLAVEKI